MDADPVCSCQDFEITDVVVDLRPAAGRSATAIASFKNFGKPETVRFELVETGAGWRIADIRDPGMPSLRARLQALVAPQPRR